MKQQTKQQIAAEAAQTIETNSDGNLAYKTAIILAAIEKATEILRAVIKDDCEIDTNVRELARPLLGDFAVDGDSYGVPGLEDIVENLIKLIPSRAAHASEDKHDPWGLRDIKPDPETGGL